MILCPLFVVVVVVSSFSFSILPSSSSSSFFFFCRFDSTYQWPPITIDPTILPDPQLGISAVLCYSSIWRRFVVVKDVDKTLGINKKDWNKNKRPKNQKKRKVVKYHIHFFRYISISEAVNMSPLVLQTPLPPNSLVYWVGRIYKRERKVLEIFTSSSLLGQGAGIEFTSIVLVTTKREREREKRV